MTEEPKRPEFVGGPRDGQTIEEMFPEGHFLHGSLPNEVSYPTHPPPADPGPRHIYLFIGGQYVYQGTDG